MTQHSCIFFNYSSCSMSVFILPVVMHMFFKYCYTKVFWLQWSSLKEYFQLTHLWCIHRAYQKCLIDACLTCGTPTYLHNGGPMTLILLDAVAAVNGEVAIDICSSLHWLLLDFQTQPSKCAPIEVNGEIMHAKPPFLSISFFFNNLILKSLSTWPCQLETRMHYKTILCSIWFSVVCCVLHHFASTNIFRVPITRILFDPYSCM